MYSCRIHYISLRAYIVTFYCRIFWKAASPSYQSTTQPSSFRLPCRAVKACGPPCRIRLTHQSLARLISDRIIDNTTTVLDSFRWLLAQSFAYNKLISLIYILFFTLHNKTNYNISTDYVLCQRFRNLLGYKMPHTILSFGYYPYSTFIIDKLVITNSL